MVICVAEEHEAGMKVVELLRALLLRTLVAAAAAALASVSGGAPVLGGYLARAQILAATVLAKFHQSAAFFNFGSHRHPPPLPQRTPEPR